MVYSKLKDTWTLFGNYKKCSKECYYRENYAPKITMPFQDWQQYVASGNNTLLGDAIIPNGTEQIPFSQNGAVYKGHVRQGYMMGRS